MRLHFILIFILSGLLDRLTVNSQPFSITIGKTLMKTTLNVVCHDPAAAGPELMSMAPVTTRVCVDAQGLDSLDHVGALGSMLLPPGPY